MVTIQVLMSTYNGEKYLREQLESIILQKDVNVRLLVRDDGSSDSTIEILEEYKNRDVLEYVLGENIGWRKSFFKLLMDAPEADYYAFADQDDYWLPDKLISGIKRIRGFGDKCALYCSDTYYWKEGYALRKDNPNRKMDKLADRIIWTMTQGCTYVFNKGLIEVIKTNPPELTVAHDGWLLKVASLIGEVYYDETPHIYYRQHDDNSCGSTKGLIATWKRRLHNFISVGNEPCVSLQMEEILRIYGGVMNDKKKQFCHVLANYRKEKSCFLKLLFSNEYTSSSISATLGFKIRVLVKKA